jgi:hypothetical protein
MLISMYSYRSIWKFKNHNSCHPYKWRNKMASKRKTLLPDPAGLTVAAWWEGENTSLIHAYIEKPTGSPSQATHTCYISIILE